MHRRKTLAAECYKETRARILEKLIKGSVIHADETPIVRIKINQGLAVGY